MGSKAATNSPDVQIFPVPGQYIVGVPAVAQTVTADIAAELLAYGGPHNPVFTTEPLSAVEIQARIRDAVLAENPEPSPPAEEAVQPEPTGSIDTTEVPS